MNGDEAGTTVLVLAGGDAVDAGLRTQLPAFSSVIAADSGLEQAARLGLEVDIVVGDLDSVDADTLAAAQRSGVKIEEYPAAKDHTDLELAVLTAQRMGAARVVVVGAWGGRIDHELANILLLGSPEYAALHLEAVGQDGRIVAVHDHVDIAGSPGDIVTLLAVGQAAHGVQTAGLLYPLRGETLLAGSTRGVSNELVGTHTTVDVESGVLLALLPTAEVV